jgi:hypothetical protein
MVFFQGFGKSATFQLREEKIGLHIEQGGVARFRKKKSQRVKGL